MTAEGIERLVGEWTPRLGLSHWKVEVDWTKPVKDGAAVDWQDHYDVAWLRFANDYTTWTPEYAEWTVVHELVHLVLRDLDLAVKAPLALIDGEAHALATDRYEHELEGAVDRMAASLVAVAHQRTGRIVHGDATC